MSFLACALSSSHQDPVTPMRLPLVASFDLSIPGKAGSQCGPSLRPWASTSTLKSRVGPQRLAPGWGWGARPFAAPGRLGVKVGEAVAGVLKAGGAELGTTCRWHSDVLQLLPSERARTSRWGRGGSRAAWRGHGSPPRSVTLQSCSLTCPGPGPGYQAETAETRRRRRGDSLSSPGSG